MTRNSKNEYSKNEYSKNGYEKSEYSKNQKNSRDCAEFMRIVDIR